MKDLRVICFVGMMMFILNVTNLFAQAPDTLWTKTYGGTAWDKAWSVQQTTDGGYIITGYTQSFGAGYEDVYLLKTDSCGDTLWTKTYGGVVYDYGFSVQQTTDGGYIIAGWTWSFGPGYYDVYLIKTNSSGDTLWTKTYGSSDPYEWDQGYSVQQTTDGGYIIAGYTEMGAGSDDVWLIKTNSSGDILWTRIYGGVDDDNAWSVQQTPDNGYIIVGFTESVGAGSYDIWLIKTNSSGDTIWTKTYGGTGADYGYSVQQTTDSGYIVLGRTESFGAGSYDVWLIKTNSSGDTLWTKTYGGIGADAGHSVQQTTDGGYIISGYTSSYGAGDYDAWLIKTNSFGDTLWTKTYGGTDADIGYSVQQTTDSGYIIAGFTRSYGAGDYDVYLIKTEPEPVGIAEHQDSNCKIQYPFLEIYPNPFRKSTVISYSSLVINDQLPVTNDLQCPALRIYDASGRVARSFPIINLCNPNKSVVSVYWDGKNDFNRKVPSGVYFVRLETPDHTITKKAILLR